MSAQFGTTWEPAPLQPAGPANLCASVGAWLTELGFAVQEQHGPGAVWVRGTWCADTGERYQLEYTWGPGQPAHATCALWVEAGLGCAMLFTPMYAPALAQVQQLLLASVRFRCAYAQAHPGTPLPY